MYVSTRAYEATTATNYFCSDTTIVSTPNYSVSLNDDGTHVYVQTTVASSTTDVTENVVHAFRLYRGTWVSVGASVSSFSYWTVKPETPEERAARERREAEEAKRRREAERKALKLLKDLISPKEFRQFRRKGYIDVKGPTGVRYRLTPGRRIDVWEGPGDQVSYRLCLVHEDSKIPHLDLLIQELLLLTSGEQGEQILRRTARRWAA